MKVLLNALLILVPVAVAHGASDTNTPSSFLNTTPTVLQKVSGITFTDIALRPNLDVWAASLDTIVRYDGHDVANHRLPGVSSAGLPVARVAELFIDSAQRVWAAGFDGRIFRFNPDAERFQTVRSIDVQDKAVTEAKHDGETELWFGFSDGSCLVVDIEMQSTQKRCKGMEGPIVDFAFDSASTFILSEHGTVLRFNADPAAGPERSINHCSFADKKFTQISALDRDTMLLGTLGNGLFKCSLRADFRELGVAKAVDSVSRKTTVHEITVAVESGRIFVGTDSGVDVLDAESLNLLYSSKFASDLVNTEFTALALQGNDTVWASSFAGLYRLHASATVVTKDLPGNPTPSIVGFASREDRVVVADYAGLFLSQQREGGTALGSKIQHMCDISGGITAVTTWGNNIIYGLRSGGVFQVPVEAGQLPCGASTLITNVGPISTLISTRDDLLIGTFGKGAYRFNSKTGLKEIEATKHNDLAHKRVLHIEQIRSLGFLLLTEGGVLTAPNEPNTQAALNQVAMLLEGTTPWAASTFGNTLWLATPTNGVFAVSLKDFPSREPEITIHHVLSGKTVQAVEAISNTEALVSSTTDLFKLSTDGSVQHALSSAGSTAVRFDFGASFRDQSGIYFGGTGGYARIDPSTIRPPRTAPHHHVASYAIGGSEFRLYRPLTQADKVLLSADKQRLTFKLGSLAPWAAHDLKHRYRLEGFDSDWIRGRLEDEVSYTNLPPGSYEFQSQTRTRGGEWNYSTLSLQVEVLPPWWRSSWALIVYAISAIGLLAVAKHYYGTILVSRRASQLAREMTATAEQAMEDMQDEVETQARLLENVTSRNVATLSWIGEVVGRQADTLPDALSSEMAKASLERIEAFVCLEHALRYRDDRVLADLRSFTDECSAMLLSRRSHGSTVTLINEVSDTLIDAAHAARLATVIYELLANALDHAFVGREYGNFLRVALELTPEPHAEAITASVIAEDNGVGLPEGVSLEEYETSGFSLVREVTAHYGGRLAHKTTGGGSSLRVELPLPEDAVA